VSVQITYPANNQDFLAPTNLTVRATASSPNGPIRRVEFFEGTNAIGMATVQAAGAYLINWTPVLGGTHILTARATDNVNSNALSAPVTNLVRNPPSVTITNPIN